MRFTDAAAHVDVTGGARGRISFDVAGLDSEGLFSGYPVNAYDPHGATSSGITGDSWASLSIGNPNGRALLIAIEGQDPCALDGGMPRITVSLRLGQQDGPFSDSYGCRVKVDAFNSSGIRGTFDCPELAQSGWDAPTISARGTFAAIGVVTSPRPAPVTVPPTPT